MCGRDRLQHTLGQRTCRPTDRRQVNIKERAEPSSQQLQWEGNTDQAWGQESCLDSIPLTATKPLNGDSEDTEHWPEARGEGIKNVTHQKRAELKALLS